MKIMLEVPSEALDAISDEILKHNAATGATLELGPFLEKHLVELAIQPALAIAIPLLEQQRDASYAASLQAKSAELVSAFADVPL